MLDPLQLIRIALHEDGADAPLPHLDTDDIAQAIVVYWRSLW